MVVQKLNDVLAQGTQSDPAIILYLLGNSLNNLTTAEYTEQELELFEVKWNIVLLAINWEFLNSKGQGYSFSLIHLILFLLLLGSSRSE